MPAVLVTGASRARGIAAAIARTLAGDGWDVGLTWWLPADEGLSWAGAAEEPMELVADLQRQRVRVAWCEADLSDSSAPAEVFDAIQAKLGLVSGLVNSHARSRSGGLFD